MSQSEKPQDRVSSARAWALLLGLVGMVLTAYLFGLTVFFFSTFGLVLGLGIIYLLGSRRMKAKR